MGVSETTCLKRRTLPPFVLEQINAIRALFNQCETHAKNKQDTLQSTNNVAQTEESLERMLPQDVCVQTLRRLLGPCEEMMLRISPKSHRLFPLHVVYKSDRFGNGCLMATSVTHMGSEAIKPPAGHARKTPLFRTRIQNKSVRFIPRASSSDQNSVKPNAALARLSVSNAHMETITLAETRLAGC